MEIDVKITYKKLQYDINREVAKISAKSSGKVDKYKYLTGHEILSSNERRIFSFRTSFSETNIKKVSAIKSLKLNQKDELMQVQAIFLQNLMNNLVRAKLKEILNLQDIIKTGELLYKSKLGKVYNFNEYSLPNVT